MAIKKQNLQELTELSGEAGIKQPPKLELPTVRLDGRNGIFYKYINKEGTFEKEELGKEIKGVMLKVRRTFSEFSKTYRTFTNEHNSWKDKLVLFESKKTERGTSILPIDEGLIKELRERHPNLRMRQVIYFMFQPTNEIVKLIVKGKGLSNLFEYWKEFETNEHMFQYVSGLKVKEETGELGTYFSVEFEKVEKIEDISEVAEQIFDISEKIKKIEDFYSTQVYTPEEIVSTIAEEAPAKEEEEINVKDIPF